MKPITSFTGRYRFLSNFAYSRVITDGPGGKMEWTTVEHAYQSCKHGSEAWRLTVWTATTPGQAKRIGRRVPLRSDWEKVKVPIMLDLLRQKFSKGYLREWLIETGDRELIEGNWWGDTYWG